MGEHHKHFGSWIIYWDDNTDYGFRFWFRDPSDDLDDVLSDMALHNMSVFPTVADGIETCEQLISDIIRDQIALTYRRVSDYHHSRNPPTVFDQDDSDNIPF